MDFDDLSGSRPVEAGEVAVRLMEAHQTMSQGDRLETRLDRLIEPGRRQPCRRDLDEGAEQRPGAAGAI